MKSNVTFVTGLWDLGRDKLSSFGRSFDHYLQCFEQLLSLDINLLIYVPENLENFVLSRRTLTNTALIRREDNDFKTRFDFYNHVQTIRNRPEWYNQVDWLARSPQAQLPLYNPIVMSKMFMLNDASIGGFFQTDYYFWIDAGLTNTVGLNFLQSVGNVEKYMAKHCPNRVLFLTYPYIGNNEIHGFERKKLAEMAGVDYVSFVPRGGFFGGYKSAINSLNGEYYSYLRISLNEGYMGTEESIFCILANKRQDLIHRYKIEDNGLVWPFFNDLQINYTIDQPIVISVPKKSIGTIKTSLYIMTYNSPEQLQALLWSFELADKQFLSEPRLYLIDNSLDESTTPVYQELCKKYNIEHLKFNNLGIGGGRQFAAEHFDKSDSDYYIFFEDDMFLFPPSQGITCRSGYRVYVQNLYKTSLDIIYHEDYDYLKLSYSEFFGTNKKQWAWYNIDDRIRKIKFPQSPVRTDDPIDCPDTAVYATKSYNEIVYYEGEFHYCNWPIWMNRKGNHKLFLETPLQFKYEALWMANAYYLLKDGKLRAAIMGLSPINHNRFKFYHADERKET